MKTIFFIFSLFILSLYVCVDSVQATQVAVLEYRSGVSEQPDFANRVVELLRSKSMAKVLSPQDCRRMLGSGTDAMVVECKENATCFAKIGRQLGVDEVLLIGMTEFGTVLLNLSRIHIAKAQTLASVDMDIQLGETVPKLRIYQLLRKLYPDDFFRRYGTLEVTSNEKGAAVKLGDRLMGRTPLDPLQLEAPREYAITVSKPGFVPFTATVDLVPNARLRLDARLSLEAKTISRAWYTRWWVITLAASAVITASAVLWWYTATPPSEVSVSLTLP